MAKLKGAAWSDSTGLHVRIPAGGNEVYQKLSELVGEPTATERYALGRSACRVDRFPCGCVRTYTASMLGGSPEAEERLDPCHKHGELVPPATEPSKTDRHIKLRTATQERMF